MEDVIKINIEKFYDTDLARIKREIDSLLNFYNDYEFVDKSNLFQIKKLLER